MTMDGLWNLKSGLKDKDIIKLKTINCIY
jgi:hypothetical protein